MDFLEFNKKSKSMGFGNTGRYGDNNYLQGFVVGLGWADKEGAYFGIQQKTPKFMSTLKNCFNLLFPTKGNELYKIVSAKNVKPQTLYMDGRKVVIEKETYLYVNIYKK